MGTGSGRLRLLAVGCGCLPWFAVVWPEFQRTDLGWTGVAVVRGCLVLLFFGKGMGSKGMAGGREGPELNHGIH
jgi:hypothetical protein